jgi:hypothetical protein
LDVTIKKVGQRAGQDRFILVQFQTRKVLTVHDVSARALRRFFHQRGVAEEVIETCLRVARSRYEQDRPRSQANEAAETVEDHDLLFELGLGGDSEADGSSR